MCAHGLNEHDLGITAFGTASLPPPGSTLLQGFACGRKTAKAIRDIAFDVRTIRRNVRATHPLPILHLIETGGPGGAERMLLDLAQHLGPEYHSVIGLLKSGWLHSQVISSGVSCAMVNGGGSIDLEVIARVLQVAREHRVGLIHAHEFYMNAIGAIVSRLTGIPLVATVHGRNYYPDKRRRWWVYRMVAAQAAAVVAVSEDLRRFFCQTTGAIPDHVRVIYNGINTKSLSDGKRDVRLLKSIGIPPEASIIGTLGNLYPIKGHVYLIRAARTIIHHRPDTHVIILGRGELKDELSAEAEALGIKDQIHLLGYRDDTWRWLSTMDVFTLPSLSEGLPLSLLEAMAAGVPPVVTEVGGMPEVVHDGKTGFMVSPREPDALARKILFLLDNPAVATRIGAAGRSQVHELFSLDKMLTKYHNLYHEVLASKSARK